MSDPVYDPDDAVMPDALWETVWLSNRDLGSQVPVNYVTRAGASLSAACFSGGVYEDTRAAKCISNLLSARYERLIVDLYWDQSSQQFYFCPASFASSPTSTSTTPAAAAASTEPTVSTALLGGASPPSSSTTSPTNAPKLLWRRQSSSTSSTLTDNSTTNAPSATSSQTLSPTSTTLSGTKLYDVGPYQCSQTLDMPWFVQMIQSYVQATENTLKANLIYIEFNLHAASSFDNPTGPAPQADALPGRDVLVGSQFSSRMNEYMYTPGLLSDERKNLNDSWFRVARERVPIIEYLDIHAVGNGNIGTSNGWPNNAYILLQRVNRLFLSWGSIDPQMSAYNVTGDSVVFPIGTLSANINVQASVDGDITSGCLYDPDEMSALQINASWTSSVPPQDRNLINDNSSLVPLLDISNNLTSCGISAQINQTVVNQTANSVPVPYYNVSQALIWNWAPGEPTNSSAGDDDDQQIYRCALLDITHAYNGRWRVEHCDGRYHAACRVDQQPYTWHVTSNTIDFSSAESDCPENTTFSAPRTGLEATYLRHYLLSLPQSTINPSSERGDSRSAVWINFNSLAVKGCWTSAGVNATCPYTIETDEIHKRTILVPVVGAIIVLAITAITLFVKCGTNRRVSRHRKRGEGGWDYEGVPS